jgi:glucokinase
MTRPWHLVADIGGTNARYGVICAESGNLDQVCLHSVAQYPNFHDSLSHFLTEIRAHATYAMNPTHTCLGVASVPDTEEILFTNSSWRFTRRSVQDLLNDTHLSVINDFTAVGYAIPHLQPSDYIEIGGHGIKSHKPAIVMGPGTGLGVASIIPSNHGNPFVVGGEGGHVDFAPVTPLEISVLEELQKRFERVSIERVLSGAGIVNLYHAIALIKGRQTQFETASEIAESASQGSDSLAASAMNAFFGILGSTAGNLALTLGAQGGVYIAGGITPRYPNLLHNSDFRARFEAKGRYKSYLQPIPLRVITKDHLGLLGAAHYITLLENL